MSSAVANASVVAQKRLRVRWLGQVDYREALSLQTSLFASSDDYLLLLEHPHTYTAGVRTKPEHILDPSIEPIWVNRGGDVTYHGPGQLVGYPIQTVAGRSGLADTARYVASIEQLLIDTLEDLGLRGSTRRPGAPGVWIGDSKIAAVGVRLSRGRSMHGFALNVNTDLERFDAIVPCGLSNSSVTSLHAQGLNVTMREVFTALVARLGTAVDTAEVVWRQKTEDLSAFSRRLGPGDVVKPQSSPQPVRMLGRLQAAGVDTDSSIADNSRKPQWMRVKANFGPELQKLKKTTRDLGLVTVCEEAGCPNIFDCWNDGTATFMINGDRCTRACGFCLVDTRKPLALDPDEPSRVAQAIERMNVDHAVVTVVARDDLADGGASAVAATIEAVHARCPDTAVEVLISDCKGNADALATIFTAKPEVLNHNIETVARLQRAVRPSAGYARSLAVLARARQAGLTTKSGMMVGLGETKEEVTATLADLSSVGVSIVTIGQYLRPTTNHLPMSRWWHPGEFDELKEIGLSLGLAHVEASPLTRSSYHAKQAAATARRAP